MPIPSSDEMEEFHTVVIIKLNFLAKLWKKSLHCNQTHDRMKLQAVPEIKPCQSAMIAKPKESSQRNHANPI